MSLVGSILDRKALTGSLRRSRNSRRRVGFGRSVVEEMYSEGPLLLRSLEGNPGALDGVGSDGAGVIV